jgi:hypothetical protein
MPTTEPPEWLAELREPATLERGEEQTVTR